MADIAYWRVHYLAENSAAKTAVSIRLNISNLSLTRGATPIIEDLSFSVESGDLLWVRGENGIGKSSLLRVCAGLLRPDSGEIMWSHDNASVAASNIASFQGHQDPLKPSLTIQENLTFWNPDTSVMEALDSVGLSGYEHRRAGTLSAGQSRRVALAKLIMDDKPLWIMDEPAAAMDARGVTLIYDLIAKHIEAGGAAIIASHAAPKSLTNTARLLTFGEPL